MNKKLMMFCVACLSAMTLSACSETKYVAHVVKQIPIPGEQQTVGHFKVGRSYTIKGRRYYPKESYNHTETGTASWYGPNFHGKPTANGETFDKYELTAAHRTLQLPSIVRVTNLANGRSAILRVNDRGPFARERVLDVSERAATILGFKNAGVARVKIEVLPEPSRQVASLAKSGQDTRGFEVALNNGVIPETPLPPRQPVQKIEVASVSQQQQAEYGTGRLMPVQSEMLDTATPVGVTLKLYVQAGSFSEEQNALNLSNSLSRIGPSKVYLTRVNERPYFRVRLGPYTDEAEAEKVASVLLQSGNTNTKIISD